jgi:hypothetical protein
VASSDLSHFYPYEQARTLDQHVLDRINAFDSSGLEQDLRNGTCEACGGGPMITVMLAARELGANKAKVLCYANSGDVTGDRSRVVGYMSAVLYSNPTEGMKSAKGEERRVGVDLGLSAEDRETLLTIARAAIRSKCLEQPMLEIPVSSERLNERRGAFVCIKINNMLKGCIGCLEARGPLHQVVRDMAVQAAFCDPRFAPLKPEEAPRIDIEISVLTPFQTIHDPIEIEIGKHGIIVRNGPRSGLLLPQVAVEHGWDRKQFLEWTCSKAGLPRDAWKDRDTQIQVFSADVFSGPAA